MHDPSRSAGADAPDAASEFTAGQGYFYRRAGRGYLATVLTRGPWDPGLQHAGPPAALLGRAVERAGEAAAYRVARITFELRRPVPIGALTVEVRHEPGRRVDRVQGVLCDRDGRVLVTAVALRIRRADTAAATHAVPTAPRMPPPTAPPAPPAGFFPGDVGYHTAMEVSFVEGSWSSPGTARAWLRPRVNLVEEEPCSPLGRVLVAADSGNGLSAVLDPRRWTFVNADLSVALVRDPTSDWVGMDARTVIGRDGGGVAHTALHDLAGPIGTGTQCLVVEPARQP